VYLTNTWLRKANESRVLTIVKWAQDHKIKVEDLTYENLLEALNEESVSLDDEFFRATL